MYYDIRFTLSGYANHKQTWTRVPEGITPFDFAIDFDGEEHTHRTICGGFFLSAEWGTPVQVGEYSSTLHGVSGVPVYARWRPSYKPLGSSFYSVQDFTLEFSDSATFAGFGSGQTVRFSMTNMYNLGAADFAGRVRRFEYLKSAPSGSGWTEHGVAYAGTSNGTWAVSNSDCPGTHAWELDWTFSGGTNVWDIDMAVDFHTDDVYIEGCEEAAMMMAARRIERQPEVAARIIGAGSDPAALAEALRNPDPAVAMHALRQARQFGAGCCG